MNPMQSPNTGVGRNLSAPELLKIELKKQFDLRIPLNAMSKKNQKRVPSFFGLDGQPKKVRVYSNLGTKNETGDCYTIVFTGPYRKRTNGQVWVVCCGTNPFHPCGIGYTEEYETHIDRPKYSHLGKKIRFADLSEDAKEYVLQKYKYLWDFADEFNRPI
jgi:hypothetical protein